MSQNRFGFQRPTNVTASTSRTYRIPGTNLTKTETHTTVTEVKQCPFNPPESGPSGLPQPRGIPQRSMPGPGRQGPIPGPGSQPPRALPQPVQSGIPARGLPRPAAGRSIPAPRQLPQPAPVGGLQPPRAIARPSAQGIPQSRLPPAPAGPPQARLLPPPQQEIAYRTPENVQIPREPAPQRVERQRQIRPPMPSRPHGIAGGVRESKLARPSIPVRPQKPSQSQNEQRVRENLQNIAAGKPEGKVSAKGKTISRLRPPSIQTPMGPEPVLQKAVFEQRVERDTRGERIVENLVVADLDEATGQMQQIELGVQQLDPSHPMDEGREVVGVTSTVSVTASYTTVEKEALRTITQPLDTGAGLDPAMVAQLVEQEKEDVENTLKMIPPDLDLTPGRHELKSRLQQMRLNSESMALLEQSIIQPEPTADEAQTDPSPEAMATVMHTVETGVTPQADPDEVFHSLFAETTNEHFIKLSSVTPGPLQDVVVPTEEVPKDVHTEIVSAEMGQLADRLEGISEAEYIPHTDIFAQVMEDAKKSPSKGKNKPKAFPMIVNERSLWVNANLEHLVNVIGAEPADVLDPYDLDALDRSGELEKEMAHGMEYIVDSDPVQYASRVQLRGTQLPSYFPGYLVALPEFAETVRIARSPDEVFASAWKSAQPKYFAEESMHSTIF
ncbi:unnamed protein product [Phaedon cochleariae]|uniref:Uncharacterized protein n=1 Tax=Phaedon cochleariae TaxID=80249 RepID=A0A9P0D8R8_PHACE|nr:unnamed protein product [Phaedon cochleariae]